MVLQAKISPAGKTRTCHSRKHNACIVCWRSTSKFATKLSATGCTNFLIDQIVMFMRQGSQISRSKWVGCMEARSWFGCQTFRPHWGVLPGGASSETCHVAVFVLLTFPGNQMGCANHFERKLLLAYQRLQRSIVALAVHRHQVKTRLVVVQTGEDGCNEIHIV